MGRWGTPVVKEAVKVEGKVLPPQLGRPSINQSQAELEGSSNAGWDGWLEVLLTGTAGIAGTAGMGLRVRVRDELSTIGEG